MTKLINHIAHMRMPVACMFSAKEIAEMYRLFYF